MGREAKCRASLGKSSGEGKALLETTELVFRGEGLKFKIPFAEVKKVSVARNALVIESSSGTARLELGDAAAKWADAIQNPKGRLDKLGVKPGMQVSLIDIADEEFRAELARRAPPAKDGPCDLLFYGAERREALARLAQLKRRIRADGAIWVVRPKGSSAITEAEVLAAGKAAGLVDTKVVAFSATHTAEKLVIPVASRPRK